MNNLGKGGENKFVKIIEKITFDLRHFFL